MARTDPRPHYGERRPSLMTTGYMRVYAPTHPLAGSDGYVLEHRKVLFDAGIEVLPGAHVHHRNHNRTDNRVENLEVIASNSEHQRLHQDETSQVTNQYGTWEKGSLIGVLVKVDPETHKAWKAAAQAEGRSMGNLYREVLTEYLEAKAQA